MRGLCGLYRPCGRRGGSGYVVKVRAPLGCGPVGLVDGDMVSHGMANVQYGLLMAIPAIPAISISRDYSKAGNGCFLRNN